MKAHIVTLPGDYIGPEIVAQAVKGVKRRREKIRPYVLLLTSAGSAAHPSTRSACR